MEKWFEWGWLTFSILTKKCQSMITFVKVWLRKYFLKMHGPKSKFIVKAVQVRKQEDFEKEGGDFEIKEDGRR